MDYPQKRETWVCSDGQEFEHFANAVLHEKRLKPGILIPYLKWEEAIEELTDERDEAYAVTEYLQNQPMIGPTTGWLHGIAEGKKLAYAHALRVIEALKGE